MDEIKIEIVVKRNDDNTGEARWLHETQDGRRYGDYVEMSNFDAEFCSSLLAIAEQAALTVGSMYSEAKEGDDKK